MEYVKLEIEGKLAKLVLNRPKSLNALNGQTYEELLTCLERIEADDSIRVVILTGAGDKAFAAGADIAHMVQLSAVEGRRLSERAHKVCRMMETMRQVVIAAVNGYALGGGCELSLACDLRIASEKARFGLPEVGLGILPAAGGTQRLSRIVGIGRAKEMIFTGKQIDAQEAWRIGLVNEVVPHEELMTRCEAVAETICSKGGFAVSMAKSAITASADMDLTNGTIREMDLLGLTFATEDKTEGMTAFLERRKPQFRDF